LHGTLYRPELPPISLKLPTSADGFQVIFFVVVELPIADYNHLNNFHQQDVL
jgi:hypothetical protein